MITEKELNEILDIALSNLKENYGGTFGNVFLSRHFDENTIKIELYKKGILELDKPEGEGNAMDPEIQT